jgi:hypothetical protein
MPVRRSLFVAAGADHQRSHRNHLKNKKNRQKARATLSRCAGISTQPRAEAKEAK